jgi:hypothetical protein
MQRYVSEKVVYRPLADAQLGAISLGLAYMAQTESLAAIRFRELAQQWSDGRVQS